MSTRSDLRMRVQRNPIASLGVGAAAGWVLGGGLTLRNVRRLLGTAGRAAVGAAIAAAVSGARRNEDGGER